MSAPAPAPQMPGQVGGAMPRFTLFDEIQVMTGHFLLLALVLVSVYVSRIPTGVLNQFRKPLGQVLGLVAVLAITHRYGWIHGILAALAYALVISHAIRMGKAFGLEGFDDSYPAAVLLPDSSSTILVPQKQRWFSEEVLGENPFLIREKEVSTSAVQDMSERGMGSSTASFSR